MPGPHPQAFSQDVGVVARRGEAPVEQIAQDFGISESCLGDWIQAADVEDGNRPGVTASESAELRELRKRTRLLEKENEILRRAAAHFRPGASAGKVIYPLVSELAGDGISVAVTCRVLKLAR